MFAVALDSGGAETTRPFIEKAQPTYPCVIDRGHVVSGLYGMRNVPAAVWIDEDGRIVRPAEPPGTLDIMRLRDPQTRQIPEAVLADAQRRKLVYLDAVRDWVRNGAASRFAQPGSKSPQQAREDDGDRAAAMAHFRLGEYLYEAGREGEAIAFIESAARLDPRNWNLRRQVWALLPALGVKPNVRGDLAELGDDISYYPPIRLPGLD